MPDPTPPAEQHILDRIDKWHESASDLPLHEYLGWTWEAYCRWVETGTPPTERAYEQVGD